MNGCIFIFDDKISTFQTDVWTDCCTTIRFASFSSARGCCCFFFLPRIFSHHAARILSLSIIVNNTNATRIIWKISLATKFEGRSFFFIANLSKLVVQFFFLFFFFLPFYRAKFKKSWHLTLMLRVSWNGGRRSYGKCWEAVQCSRSW